MAQAFLSIDFEYNNTKEQYMNVVCFAATDSRTGLVTNIWTHRGKNPKQVEEFLDYKHGQGYMFLSHSVVAESSALLSLKIDPLKYNWIDTFIEFRMVTNHLDHVAYGKHLIGGKEKTLRKPKPKWQRTEDEKKGYGGKIDHTLAQLVYRFCGTIIDTTHKTEMRDLIISSPKNFTVSEREAIEEYCASDTQYLLPAFKKILWFYKEILTDEDYSNITEEMLWRGETAVRTAMMERSGYPIEVSKVKNLSASTTTILKLIQKDINEQFPDIKPFWLDKKTRLYTQKKKPINEWIESLDVVSNWLLTDKQAKSHSLDAFMQHFPFRHEYPRGNFGAQMVRYLHTKQNLNGFVPAKTKAKRKKFKEYIGKDNIVRPYLNLYGSQSARFQPSATGFIHLKAAWMRTVVHPPKGKMIVAIDYKSQEFYLSALLSGDEDMIAAYKTGDVYLAFGQSAGGIPKDGTKQSHPKERQAFKSTVLGLSYAMTKYGLAKKLTNDVGKKFTEDEAEAYVNLFNRTYPVFVAWRNRQINEYKELGYLRLPDGWVMFGDNDNDRSIGNCPVQGFGSCIIRRAIQLTQDKGIRVLFPLHDALYVMVDLNDWATVEVFTECMQSAFKYFMPDAEDIGLDCEAHGDGLKEGREVLESIKVTTSPVHIDERSINEYNKFKKYFLPPDSDLL